MYGIDTKDEAWRPRSNPRESIAPGAMFRLNRLPGRYWPNRNAPDKPRLSQTLRPYDH